MKLMNLVLLALLATGSAAAQNSDLGFLFSVARTRLEVSPRFIETQYRVGLQGNYAWQVLERPVGRLYLEVPVATLAAPLAQGSIVAVSPSVSIYARQQGAIF